MRKLIATWNPTTQLWETDQTDLFSEQQAPYSETWPTSGMTQSGQLLPLPTSEPHTDENVSSSLLPTPNAEVNRGTRSKEGIKKRIAAGDKQFSLEDAITLLPTPVAREVGTSPERYDQWCAEMKSQHGNGNGHGASLSVEAQRHANGDLLPTPCARDYKDGQSPAALARRTPSIGAITYYLPTPRSSDCFGAGHHGNGGMDLRTTISLLPTPRSHRRGDCESERNRNDPDLEATTHYFPLGQWGKYEPAIRRWETLTRSAPAPTESNKNGNPRLSAAFSEWMMGWPSGWVTDPDIGISRNDQLKIVGNGVCPQQAYAALRYLASITDAA